MSIDHQTALRTAFSLRDLGHPLDAILNSPFIPPEFRESIRIELEKDENMTLTPAKVLVADHNRVNWLGNIDRSEWHYWPTLRQYLATTKGWKTSALRSLDDTSDRILRQLSAPDVDGFDIRGLVLGYVQSGKTASFTAVAAKAADAGYRLIIVLSGIDKGLRRQTNIRLKRELVGYSDNRAGAVKMPPVGQRWHEFTNEDLEGDFQPGMANHAALQGSQPVLIVMKKNGAVLRRLLRWLDDAPPEVRRTLPFLLIDDEADQASVDTRGSYQVENDPADSDYEPPSVINGLIRNLLRKFERRAYIAYTATPFANILIPHDTTDPRVGNDLYPKDFIVDLPKPNGYFGAEEFFGRMDSAGGEDFGGLDVIREVTEADVEALEQGHIPPTLGTALLDFVLSGAARGQRNQGDDPATMLIHTSHLRIDQAQLTQMVDEVFGELRDEWRYQRTHGIFDRLAQRWESEYRPVIRTAHFDRDVPFEKLAPHIGPFLEAVQVRMLNMDSGEVLDYEREPSLKAIAIGGNKLSRGLTLEGLLVSYYIRRVATYDTLMQMGRWFGFRGGYEDITRIWTTRELANWFSDLAFVEHRLREDIQVYEDQGLKPHEVGMRIWQHPAMQVTSALKRRFATGTTIAQSYSLALEQTFKYPLNRLDDLAVQAEANRLSVCELVARLREIDPVLSDNRGPVWTNVGADVLLEFLRGYRIDDNVQSVSLPLICAYIERLVVAGELTRWTIAVRGLGNTDPKLGSADWGLPTGLVSQVSRSRLGFADSVGAIRDPEDEAMGLNTIKRGRDARAERSAQEGLLLLYPISRYSGYKITEGQNRRQLFDDPDGPLARDLVGLAISFPRSNQPQIVEAYLEGTVGWRPVE